MKIDDHDLHLYVSIIEQSDRLLANKEILENARIVIQQTKDDALLCMRNHLFSLVNHDK